MQLTLNPCVPPALVGALGIGDTVFDVIAMKEGADLVLSCPIVVQNEDMIISWTCNNEPANIKSSRIHVTDTGKLRILSAKVGDSCNYRCEAADGFGTLSVIIQVIIVDKSLMATLAKQNNSMTAAATTTNQIELKSTTTTTSNKHPQQDIQLATRPANNHNYPMVVNNRPLSVTNQISNDHGNNNNKSLSNKSSLPEQVQQQQQQHHALGSELEIYIEPATVKIERNKSFTLECRVKHAPQLIAPQIMWLKEYIGRKPRSLREAHERNLVLIDGVYFHSLNWPRSNAYSRETACANSALLIRQSSYVHSGKYICFAGYAPSLMSLNLSSSSLSSPTSANNNNQQRQLRQPLRYKLAQAEVQVDDTGPASPDSGSWFGGATADSDYWTDGDREGPVGDEQGQDRDTSAYGSLAKGERTIRNVLISVLTTNTWARNGALALALVCLVLYVTKHCPMRPLTKRAYNRCSPLPPPATTTTTTTTTTQLLLEQQQQQQQQQNKAQHQHHMLDNHHYRDGNDLGLLCGGATRPKSIYPAANGLPAHNVEANARPAGGRPQSISCQAGQQQERQMYAAAWRPRLALKRLTVVSNLWPAVVGRHKNSHTGASFRAGAATARASPKTSEGQPPASSLTSRHSMAPGQPSPEALSFGAPAGPKSGLRQQQRQQRQASRMCSSSADLNHVYSEIGDPEATAVDICVELSGVEPRPIWSLENNATGVAKPLDVDNLYQVPKCDAGTKPIL